MAKKRYVNTRDQSFFGNYVYDQVVPQTYFLRLLNQLIDWERFTERLIELYRGGGEYGRPPFDPTQLLKLRFMLMKTCLPNTLLGWDWIKKHRIIPR